MGTVNCKSSSRPADSPSCSGKPTRVQKTIEKRQRKSLRSFLRAVVFAKRSNKIAPDTSSTDTNSRSEIPSAKGIREILCSSAFLSQGSLSPERGYLDCPCLEHASRESDVKSESAFSEVSNNSESLEDSAQEIGNKIDLKISIQRQIQDVDCSDVQPQGTFSDSVNVVPQISERLVKLRKECITKCMLDGIQELSTLKGRLERLQVYQENRQNELALLTTVKTRTAHASRKASQLKTSIKKLNKAYRKSERKLYKLRARRAAYVANVDRCISKLYPTVKYSDIYAARQSFYLSPIPEESELDLEEYELGIFPSETNTSLAAITLRQDQLFLDASPSCRL